VLVDGPASSKDKVVPRHSARLSDLSLTPIVLSKLPRATGNGVVRKRWEEQKVEEQFGNSNWAKSRAQFEKRRQLNDFERFKVMKLRKQVGAFSISSGSCGARALRFGHDWRSDWTNGTMKYIWLILLFRLATRSGRPSPESSPRHRFLRWWSMVLGGFMHCSCGKGNYNLQAFRVATEELNKIHILGIR
jgi:ribosomal protein L14E/L6E/L27E